MCGLCGGAAGIAATSVVAVVADAVIGTAHPVAVLVALLVVSVVVSAATTAPGALVVALHAWCLYSGFFVGRAGALVFTSDTAQALLLSCAAAELAALFGPAFGSGGELRGAVRRVPPLLERSVQPPAVPGEREHPQVHVVRVGQ